MLLNPVGVRELTGSTGGNPWGTHFTPVPGLYFEDTISNEIVDVRFEANTFIPNNLEPTGGSYGFAAPNISLFLNITSSHMMRITPNDDESYTAFRARLAPFQWGIWEDDVNGEQTVVAYFGTLGVDGPRISDINANFATVSANAAINTGFYSEDDRDALIDYFTTVYGDGNVIGGRLPNIRVTLTERTDPVAVDTPLTNTMTVTRNGVPQNSSGTATLRPMIGNVTPVPGDRAELVLMDQITNAALEGGEFQLQVWTPPVGDTPGVWSNMAGRTYTTGDDGRFRTETLGTGTFRFIQLPLSTALVDLRYHLPSSTGLWKHRFIQLSLRSLPLLPVKTEARL